ncbi:MAG: substrate-binding domain-containing protein [Akkermansiaceae bacterium]|nr:substrate-binding domain-containing protein [Akkermansiaceae bacterium]
MANRVDAKAVRQKRGPAESAILLPARHSLVSQTVELMRGLISDQQWSETLPSEDALRTQLGISRVTLRKALAELVAQGWLTPGGRGNRHRIIPGMAPTPQKPAIPGSVKCLSQFAEIDLALSMRIILDEIRNTLQPHGRSLELLQRAALWRGNPTKRLSQITAEPGTAGWILHRASPQMQRWFQESHLPCLVLGPCHENVRLPCVQIDNDALGRHAAAEAARLGHHHIAFVVFDPNAASALNTLHGFRQFYPKDGRQGRVTIINDDQTPEGIRTALSTALNQPDPPTLIMVSEAVQALPVMGILREMNLQIPEDISLVVRDDEPFLSRCVPELSRYTFDWLRFGRTISRILTEMIESGGVKVVNRKFLPVFTSGQTLTHRRPHPIE